MTAFPSIQSDSFTLSKEFVSDRLDEHIIDGLRKKNARQRLSDNTKKRYKTIIQHFNQFLADHELKISQESLIRYFDFIAETMQPATLNLHKTALLKCVKAQIGQDNIVKNIAIEKAFEQIEIYKRDHSVASSECVTEQKVKQMVDNAPTRKTALIILFLYKTGLRVGEMINIRLRDCERKDDYVKIRIIGKGKKERRMSIPHDLYRDIRRTYTGKTWLFESCGGNPLNVNNVGHQIRRTAERIGLSNFHTHLLRHSRATDMLKNKGISLKAVSRFLGHASVATTAEMYVHDEVDYQELFSKDCI